MQSSVFSVLFYTLSLRSLHCEVLNFQMTVFSIPCAVFSVQFYVGGVQCAVFTIYTATMAPYAMYHTY